MKKFLVFLTLLTPFTPITAMADGYGVCTDLIPAIVRNYDVANLKLIRDGNPLVTESLVSCAYHATTPELWGDRPIVLTVLLNLDNGRFQAEVR